MLDGIVTVLKEWDWSQRPTAVVSIGSRTRPGLIHNTAQRIAEIGRLPHLGTVAPANPDPDARRAAKGNSAQRLLQVHDAFRLPDPLSAALADPAHRGPILLVDDRVDTGWTMTVTARLLRQSGADAVLPFALTLEA
jgi:ATP-dependent DNA helicase RecQ